eukprot:3915238-Pyramimonas_sp.AAC.1
MPIVHAAESFLAESPFVTNCRPTYVIASFPVGRLVQGFRFKGAAASSEKSTKHTLVGVMGDSVSAAPPEVPRNVSGDWQCSEDGKLRGENPLSCCCYRRQETEPYEQARGPGPREDFLHGLHSPLPAVDVAVGGEGRREERELGDVAGARSGSLRVDGEGGQLMSSEKG